jgi:hypothetical protein
MLLLAGCPVEGKTGLGLDVVDGTEKAPLGREFEKEGAEGLEERSVSRDVGIPVARVPSGLRRIGDGPGELTALTAKGAPLIRRKGLKGVAVQIDTCYAFVPEASRDVLADLQKHPGKQGEILRRPIC